MKVKVIIIDDEPRAHKILEAYIGRLPDLELTGSFMNAVAAFHFLETNKVDLALLDISMPEEDGFAMLRKLQSPPLVIFCTAHPEFALESYEYDAIDYLKKPISFDRFVKGVNKAISLLASKAVDPLPDRIDLRIDGEIRSISFSSIHYFQSLGNYIKVITDEKPMLTQVTTHEIESMLPKELFIRIHKSYIVSRAKMVMANEDEVILNGIKLPIGKTFKKYVKDAIGNDERL